MLFQRDITHQKNHKQATFPETFAALVPAWAPTPACSLEQPRLMIFLAAYTELDCFCSGLWLCISISGLEDLQSQSRPVLEMPSNSIHPLYLEAALDTPPVKCMKPPKKRTSRCFHTLVQVTEVLYEQSKGSGVGNILLGIIAIWWRVFPLYSAFSQHFS